jgi:hypothetical protein
MLGPNLDCTYPNDPFTDLLNALPTDKPTLLFWYIGTNNFETFEQKVGSHTKYINKIQVSLVHHRTLNNQRTCVVRSDRILIGSGHVSLNGSHFRQNQDSNQQRLQRKIVTVELPEPNRKFR